MNARLIGYLYEAFRGQQFKATVVLLTSTPLMIAWRYYGSADFYRDRLTSVFLLFGDVEYTAAAYMFISSLVVLGLIPLLIVKAIFREPLSDYGVCVGDWRKGALALLVFVPIFLLASYIGTRDPSVREFYPINRSAARAFALHALLFFGFYAGWEFHFRGFLQHGLRDSMGKTNAILVQVMASTLLHIGLPASETFMAIPAGVLWGVMAFQTRSILPGLLLHFLLGISADYFLLY